MFRLIKKPSSCCCVKVIRRIYYNDLQLRRLFYQSTELPLFCSWFMFLLDEQKQILRASMLEVVNRIRLFTYILIKCETSRIRIIMRIKAS
jgi:hypothetical protein